MKQLKKYLSLGSLLIGLIFIAAKLQAPKSVLIIGDSISIGYTPLIKKSLPGVDVEHNQGNAGSTVRGVENIEKWIDNREWDVVVFNFGLHDLVYKDSLNRLDLVHGKLSVSLDDYRKNLQTIVDKLRETTAKLVFVTTTTVPENAVGRKVESPAQYNKVAKEVMKKNGIEVLDLYKTSLTVHPQNSNPGNVHYTGKGYQLLSEPIVVKIKSILNN